MEFSDSFPFFTYILEMGKSNKYLLRISLNVFPFYIMERGNK